MKKKSKKYLDSLTPAQIVAELDRFIIGQNNAKRAVAIALRNRYRRQAIEEPLRSEVMPKNILMIGSTGVGKTEIARRLAKLTSSPFIKVEATKFTEVGYVGRDVESIIRDLMTIAVNDQKIIAHTEVKQAAEDLAIEKILDVLAGPNSSQETRKSFKNKILKKTMDDVEIEIFIPEINKSANNNMDFPGVAGASGVFGILNIGEMLGKALSQNKNKIKKITIKEALKILTVDESEKLIDHEHITAKALKLVENNAIVFIDEIDKVVSSNESRNSDISRQGVQRDLLPIIEGTVVTTRYGNVSTDHILFIASGAFHVAKPSDLLPELQGRLPIRVELLNLTKEDMIRILLEPEASLIKQYKALMDTENIELEFTTDAIAKIADYAISINREVDNIGARRLHAVMEKLLEEISFNASDMKENKIIINEIFVDKQLSELVKNVDLSKFIL
jgi:ATP-dependent HslUV protease ATP-binding subunit HslU